MPRAVASVTRKVVTTVPEYDFRSLSPIDFERLTGDILNADLGLALQGYAPGRDQGIDLRQVETNGTVTVVQCKHYLDSSWSTFLRAVRKEAGRGQELKADRYLFTTSRALTPPQQDEVVETLKPLGVTHESVWDRGRLNAALSRHSDVERRHPKLWLSSTGVLEMILHAGRWQRGEATLDRVRDRAKFWVHTTAYDEALNVLDREGVCVVYGPPGVGKTFLAEMVLLAAAAEGWNVVHVSGNIEDAWGALRTDGTNQIFYYNDFLGEVQLQVDKSEPTELAHFIERVRVFRGHKRLIMTTREQILQEGTNEYDALQDRLDVAALGMRMKQYPARVRAEILFNHLYFSMPQEDREHIALDNRIATIVEHPAYNPRLIETALATSARGTADEKLAAIAQALDHPDRLWKTSFQKLPPLSRQILLVMATLPGGAWPLRLIQSLVATDDLMGWPSALQSLESTWIGISGQRADRHIAFANPSCRDYVLTLLDDAPVAENAVEHVSSLDQVASLTRSAGLLPDITSPMHRTGTQRPELAHALMSRREQLMELTRGRADADRPGAQLADSVQLLREAAAMVAVYGTESDTDWLMGHIQSLVESVEYESAVRLSGAFLLAEALAGLQSRDPGQRDVLAGKLVMGAIRGMQSSRDLDAYEALPQDLKTPAVEEAARESARRVLAEESSHLLHNVEDADWIRVGAAEIDQRAAWYQLNVNIGPLLDKASELEALEDQASPWPSTEGASEAMSLADDAETIRDVFSRFNH
jgi:hypothetical protein